MKGKVLLIAGLVLLAGCEKEDKGPWGGLFGTKGGLTVSQLEKHAVLQKKGGPNQNNQSWYESPQAPDMSANADGYIYIIGEQSGLCMVGAKYNSLTEANSKIVDQLKSKYGQPMKDGSVDSGVIWSSDKYKLEEGMKSIRIRFDGDTSAQVSAVYLDSDCK